MQFGTDSTGRVNSVTLIGEDDRLPDGMTESNWFDFIFRDGQFIFDPLPEEKPPEDPTAKTIAGLKAQMAAQAETLAMYEEILVELAEIAYA